VHEVVQSIDGEGTEGRTVAVFDCQRGASAGGGAGKKPTSPTRANTTPKIIAIVPMFISGAFAGNCRVGPTCAGACGVDAISCSRPISPRHGRRAAHDCGAPRGYNSWIQTREIRLRIHTQ
jgi:hypothetical protein